MTSLIQRPGETPDQFASRLQRRKELVDRVEECLREHPKRMLARVMRRRDWAAYWSAYFGEDQAKWDAASDEERMIAELRSKVGDRVYDALIQKHLPGATA